MARALCCDLVAAAGSLTNIDILLCPPSILLHRVSQLLADSRISSGAQDIDEHESGPYTGQISASMVHDAGGRYAILGHSERRVLYSETDAQVAAKVTVALSGGIVPIICVGETLDQRERGLTTKTVLGQVKAVITNCGIDAFHQAIIAYEPIWAIGTGLTATPEQAQKVHAMIRQQLDDYDTETAARCRILYGGSMQPGNVTELVAQPDIDGGLIGGASLIATEFLAICRATSQASTSTSG